jgi:peptidoglycan/LPS O-acetylase OafA/YrhL
VISRFNKGLLTLFFVLIFAVLPFCKIFYHTRLPYLACCLYPGIALFWGWTVWRSIDPGTIINKIFTSRALIFFGKISYGLYIFHWPVNRLIRLSPGSASFEQSGLSGNLLLSFLSTSIAILAAVISYYTYERYFLRLKKYFT